MNPSCPDDIIVPVCSEPPSSEGGISTEPLRGRRVTMSQGSLPSQELVKEMWAALESPVQVTPLLRQEWLRLPKTSLHEPTQPPINYPLRDLEQSPIEPPPHETIQLPVESDIQDNTEVDTQGPSSAQQRVHYPHTKMGRKE